MNLTDTFLKEIYELSRREMSREAVMQAKACLLDYLACAYAGGATVHEDLERYISLAEAKQPAGAVVLGTCHRVNVSQAALLCGIAAHVLEMDDGHRYAMMHPGATVISPLLSMVQVHDISAQRFIRAIVTGYEAAIRLAAAIQPSHKLRGFHATGTCGTMGAALGLCVLLDVDFSRWNAVLSAAATGAAGLLEVIDDASMLKPYNIGRACASAVDAVAIGSTSFCGPDDILGGRRGFFATHTDKLKEEYLHGFGGKYAIDLIYRKPYAACRHCHAPIEAALRLRDRVSSNDIDAVTVATYGLAVGGHEHRSVRSSSSAKMSTPYSVAAALLYGSANVELFEEPYLEDERLLTLSSKVSVTEDPALSALVPEKRAAVVTVSACGDTFSERVDYPRGEPENPISVDELNEKYRSLMRQGGAGEKAEDIYRCVLDIENSFQEMLKLL